MRYLVAVSGGVDSVVLLNKLAARKKDCVVAHFDHGIRDDSAHDARFVEQLARQYDFPFVGARAELGKKASEEQARTHRYAFLRQAAKTHGAVIVTAHHADDVIDTIAINMVRGTGWRGLAVFGAGDIVRPLTGVTKQEIYNYALSHRLEWVEDSTNFSNTYLRNRLRYKTAQLSPPQRDQLLALWRRQRVLAGEIKDAADRFMSENAEYDRYFFTHIDEAVAVELLRGACRSAVGKAPARPQLRRAVVAIKTAHQGSTYHIGDGLALRFQLRTFIVTTP